MNYNIGFQYLVILSCLGFIHYLLINTLLDFKPLKEAPYRFKLLIYMMLSLPIVQFFVCGSRVFYTLSGDINILTDPLTSYISYLISPVGTLIIVWFLRNYFIDNRKYFNNDILEKYTINTSLTYTILIYFVIGIIFSFVLDKFLGLNDKIYTMMLFAYLTLCFMTIEIFINKVFRNKIDCVSYSWFLYFGTYVYILTKI